MNQRADTKVKRINGETPIGFEKELDTMEFSKCNGNKVRRCLTNPFIKIFEFVIIDNLSSSGYEWYMDVKGFSDSSKGR